MSTTADNVREFYAVYGDVSPELAETCLREEIDELVEVLDQQTWGAGLPFRKRLLALELADVVWCCYGHAQATGIDLDVALDIIARANMAKFPDCPNPRCEDGEVPGGAKGYLLCGDCNGTVYGALRVRSDGKVERPSDWQPPDLGAAVGGQ